MSSPTTPLRIVHCVRSAVGGTFRHIADLSREQHRAGHHVGLALDRGFGGAFEAALIAEVEPFLSLGLIDLPVSYRPGPRDLVSAWRFRAAVAALRPDVLHGHGAKGGLYARLAGLTLRRGARAVAVFYTPHGGSLHYDPRSMAGRLYFGVERVLERACDGILHVSAYERAQYRQKIGEPRCPATVIHNGLRAAEFEPVAADPDAADVMVMGMFRALKGQDVLLHALAAIRERTGTAPTARLIGEGPDEATFRSLVASLGLSDRVTFHPLMPTRQGFAKARVLVVPSRAESLPYIVLEAAAAGLPLIASDVGGIPEILGSGNAALVPPGDALALASALETVLADLDRAREVALMRRADIRKRFSVEGMAAAVEERYRSALAARSVTDRTGATLQPAE
jgi:glycosyltransferase involved in cell wall biosynthesis